MGRSDKIILLASDVDRLIQIKKFIETNIGQELNEIKIAKAFGISISTLKRHFTTYFKTSVYTFILNMRMEKAMELLIARHGTVQQIALFVGYADTPAFTHKFTKYFGNVPSHYLRN